MQRPRTLGELKRTNYRSVGVKEEMRALGHEVEVLPRMPARSGAVCAVMRDPDSGLVHAGADPRRECYALAW